MLLLSTLLWRVSIFSWISREFSFVSNLFTRESWVLKSAYNLTRLVDFIKLTQPRDYLQLPSF